MIPSPRSFACGFAALLASSSALLAAAAPAPAPALAAELFPLADVRLLDGPFLHAQELDRTYLLAHDVDRFMAPFRTAAGLEPKAPKYPNWESTGLDGHTAGHYLAALAQLAAVTGDAEIRRRMDYMVSEYAACQRASGNGYVGAVPGGREFWAQVAAGDIRTDSFSVNGKWVPWYNLHKTFAGLRDAWLVAGSTQARDVLFQLTDWCATLVANLSDDQIQQMLRCEHGGMNEVLAEVTAITGDRQYLALAQRFSHRALLDPLLRREDTLTGLHANTQIPKVVGFARIAELGGDPAWLGAARFFWQTVVERRNVAFGGNSVREHFNPPQDFSSMLESREGPETCNTYNLLRLTETLFAADPAPRYADYYERALFNHILSSQHPGHGGLVYFTPIRPRHYRVYSQPGQCFWCCVGSGMENHGKYGRFIYAHTAGTLYVNLFLASELAWRERGVTVRQETRFPDEAATRLVFKLAQPQHFTVQLRHPSWVAAGEFTVRFNGETVKLASTPSSYAALEREWRDGDRLDVALPMRTTIEALPDRSDYVAVLHGPIVLAAKTGTEHLDGLIAGDSRMGHIAPGVYEPLDRAPMLVGDPATLAEKIRPVPGKPLTFTAADLIQPAGFRKLELVPFFRVHDARTMLYWRSVKPDDYADVVRTLEAQERERLALDARLLDQVAPGEQQPEVEHNYRGDDSDTGANLGRRWRDAGRWFGYELRTTPGIAAELRVTYFAADRNRRFDIVVNDTVVAEVALDGRTPDRFVETTYAIPQEITDAAADGKLTVKFVAKEKSRAGGIYGLRLLRQAGP